MKIASDLDGVICTIPKYWKIDEIGYDLFNSYWGWFRKRNCKPLFHPSFNFIPIYRNVKLDIITGRPESDRWYTEKWLNKNGIIYSNLIMNELGTMNDEVIAKWKAEIIKQNDYDLYYDDSLLVAKILKGICDYDLQKIYTTKNIVYEFRLF